MSVHMGTRSGETLKIICLNAKKGLKMDFFKKLKDEHYQNKVDEKLDYQNVFKLQEECSRLDLFINIDTYTGPSTIDTYNDGHLAFF